MKALAIAMLVVLSFAESASACFPPMDPGDPPRLPFCESFGDWSACDRWEVDDYNRRVRRYLGDLEQFDVATDAYVQCRLDELRRRVR